jgi:ArsR family transcriptional regulator, arsenate/arsenite/antimonite-responsive transcriptional repressor
MIASDRELVKALRALADTNRFRMVQEVAAAGELSCGQIRELFPLSQPTVSHHLKILSDAGVLIPRADAKHRFLSVNQELLDAIGEALAARLAPRASPEPDRR